MEIKQWLDDLANQSTPPIEDCIEQLGPFIAWLYKLEETPQDPEWHAEGNVLIHTGMVLKALYQLLSTDAHHIQGWQRQALILSAILHDIAKSVCTREAKVHGVMRITSPQHAAYGRSYLAFKLMQLPLSFDVIWAVLNLVGEHHQLKRLVVQNKSAAQYFTMARQVSMELVYWLEVADMRGRITPDINKQLSYLDEFKLFAEEYEVWGETLAVRDVLQPHLEGLDEKVQDYVYAHALHMLENGKITQAEEALGAAYQHRENHPHVVILCGPSGSGKSRWIQKNYPDYDLVSLDLLREEFNGNRSIQKNKGQIQQAAKERLKVSLRQQHGVVWDATNLRSDFRAIIAGLGCDYHALVTLVVMLLPEKVMKKNNRDRQHSVPESVLEKQVSSYQLPSLNEAHQYWVVGEHGQTLFRSGYFT